MVSGELDPLSTGVVYCELVCALQGLAQYDLAEQWTEAMERWCEDERHRQPARPLPRPPRRDPQAARVLRRGGDGGARRLRGAAAVSAPRARMAADRARADPASQGRPRGRRGGLSRRSRAGWDPQPGLALVRLARGDAATAAASIRDALEHPLRVPSKERPPDTELRRAPLLEAQVEIEIAAGDLARARSAADELTRIAARFESKALVAGATLAHGRVRLAEGDPADAERLRAEAARLWSEVGAPYETALARAGLADALRASGSEHRAALELEAARTVLDRIEAEPTADDAVPSSPTAQRGATGDRPQRVSPRGRLLVGGLRGAQRARARPQGHALPRAVARRARSRVPRARPRRAELGQVAAPERGRTPVCRTRPGDAGALLDARAKDAYRRRLAEIEDDIDEAAPLEDTERAAQADAEREFLVRELSRAVGLGGRDRRAGSASERARVSVTRALRQAMARLGEHHPELGEHLDRTIRTGTYCAYVPDPRARAAWKS